MERSGETEGANRRGGRWSRRGLIKAGAVVAGVTTIAPAATFAWMDLADRALANPAGQPSNAATASPPSVISTPPRKWGPNAPPEIYPDPDIIVIDPSFGKVLIGIDAIHRVWTGGDWLEGPAWSEQGSYLVVSDVHLNKQFKYDWETGQVSVFRDPSQNSNGNSFDFQGRQLSTQDNFRRVIRWENNNRLTVIADNFNGKPLNSPNDLVPHPDGSIWFTDPPYGDSLSEGHPDAAGGPTNPDGLLNPALGDPEGVKTGGQTRQLPTQTYRWDPSGALDVVATESQVPDPNGICFSPDYKTLYLISTGKGPGDQGPGGQGIIYAFDVIGTGRGTQLQNQRVFTDMMVDGVHCGPDGMRADVYGNLYCSSNTVLGYAGVIVFDSTGKLIGRIRLPEVAANVAFGGPKRNFLFIAASQSLYRLQLQTQGAAPG